MSFRCSISLLTGLNVSCRYFGRAKELPGVKELFQSKKTEEDEENRALSYYKKFTNQGPSYFGDLDEADGKLLEFEMRAEDEGTSHLCFFIAPVLTRCPTCRMGRCVFPPTYSPWHADRRTAAQNTSPVQEPRHRRNLRTSNPTTNVRFETKGTRWGRR